MRREYFFDVHPPLGKLLIAGVAKLLGYDGSFTFASIGQSYTTSSAPYIGLRVFMVLLSVASTALAYGTMIEMGFGVLSSAAASSLMVFDNALAIQSRFILLDSPLIFFICLSVFAWVKFRQQRAQPFHRNWWLWLLATGVAIGGATSVKMVGLFTVALIGIATTMDLWELADYRRHISNRVLYKHFGTRLLGLVFVPMCVYLASYWVHFAVLTRTGPGDVFMTSEFQSSLEGNQMNEKSRQIYYGHTIRLKSRLEDIFLHSHPHNYPRVHEDGKVSSEGQQVTGYPASDPNNLWRILPAEGSHQSDYLAQRIPIRSGEAMKLLHVGTGKLLYTHDVASPLTRTNMEITVVDPNDNEKKESTIWRVDIASGGDMLKAHSCQFRLIHKMHSVSLTNQQQPLPKWGFQQREINGDKRGVDETCKWIVWDVEEPMDGDERLALTLKPKTELSFLQKFWELQLAQVRHNAGLIDNHPFKSDPGSWPFVLRGVSYWDKGKTARIYLLGNPVAWYISLIGMTVFIAVAARELYRNRRGIRKTTKADVAEDLSHYEERFLYRSGFLLLAWAMHYFPFYTMSRTLYLHHYLPAYMMGTLVAGAILDYGHRMMAKKSGIITTITAIALCISIVTYFYFAPITYGTNIPTPALEAKKWLQSWDWP